MRAIKCYLSYTPKFYRWLVLVLLPIVLLTAGIGMSANRVTTLGLLGLLCTEVVYEVFADNWMLGGIQSKEYTGLAMVQASKGGMEYMKNVVLTDCIRRYVYMAIISICYLAILQGSRADLSGTDDIVFAWNIYWLAGAVMSLIIWISRYFANAGAGILFCYLAGFAYAFTATAMGSLKWGIVICPLIAAVASVISVMAGISKMEGCYYDK